MPDTQPPPGYIGCSMGDGNPAEIVLTNLYSGDSFIVCMLHCAELVNSAMQALFRPDDPDVVAAVEAVGDMPQAPVSAGFDATGDGTMDEQLTADSFDFDGM